MLGTNLARPVAVVVFGALLTAAWLALAAFAPTIYAGGGCHLANEAPSGGRSGAVVGMAGCSFSPETLSVSTGTTVSWVNDSKIAHIIVGAGADWGSRSEIVAGGSFDHRFDRPGVYAYQCHFHPGMVAAVIVVEPDAGAAPAVASAADSSRTGGSSDAMFLIASAAGLLAAIVGAVVGRRSARA